MASTPANVIVSVLFALFGGPGMILVYFPWRITGFRLPPQEPLPLVLVAALLIAAGLYPLFESIVRFIVVGRGSLLPALPPQHLVITGLYRYCATPCMLASSPSSPAKHSSFKVAAFSFSSASCVSS